MIAGISGLAALIVATATAPPTMADDQAARPGSASQDPVLRAINNGEDFTRPTERFELRGRYERLRDSGDLEPEKWVTTICGDAWAGLGQGWKLYGRTDLPLVYANDVTSRFNPNGHARFGVGDLLTEVAIVLPPPMPRLGYGVGLRVVWPTAGLNEAGKGKYQLGPLAGLRYDLPEISLGSFALLEVRYQNSIASRDQNSARPNINQLNIQPKLNFGLSSSWFLTFFASEDIQISFADGENLFVPIDIMVGKKFGKNIVASLEYSRSILHDGSFEPYKWQIEARIGYHFD